MIKATVVIPNYNGAAYLAHCLQSVTQQSTNEYEVLVVDNHSEDGSERVTERYPGVRRIDMDHNTGFCGAVNAGIYESRAPYVILLNNDTEVESDFVEEMIAGMERDQSLFSCCAKMIQYEDRTKMDDAGDYYCALGWAYASGKGRPASDYTRERDIFFSCAGAAIYRRALLVELGAFDEAHFAYLEDADVGYRARIHGYRNRFLPKAIVYHVGSGASGSVYNLFKTKYSSRNSIYLIYKNMPFLQIILNLPFFIVGFAVKMIFFAVKGYGGEYVWGIAKGFSLSQKGRQRGRKIPFRLKNLGNYAKIQLELWVNIIKRFL